MAYRLPNFRVQRFVLLVTALLGLLYLRVVSYRSQSVAALGVFAATALPVNQLRLAAA